MARKSKQGHFQTEKKEKAGEKILTSQHAIEIDKQVGKVVRKVKQIQAAVRRKTTSLNRMQFLHQFEDVYGFHGHNRPDNAAVRH